MGGMTLKQYSYFLFWQLVEEYQEAKKHINTAEGRRLFVFLSVQLHAAKGNVPKALWRYAR